MSDEDYEWSEEDQTWYRKGEPRVDPDDVPVDFVFEIYRYTFECQVTIEQSQKDEILGYMGSAVQEAMTAAMKDYGCELEDYSANVEVVT